MQNKNFFSLQTEDKMSIAHNPGPKPQRGWSKVGAENSSTLYRKGLLGSEVTEDLRDARVRTISSEALVELILSINQEHFDMGATNDTQFSNKWPADARLPGFRSFMENAFEKMEHISAVIMEALEMGLSLPKGSFLDRITHDHNASELRLNRYPAIDIEEIRGGGVSRIWPHFDLGVITLLFQDGVGGLECENRQQAGAFHRVESSSQSEMIVNISETLQRWTNNVVPAGLHRVNVPKDMEQQEKGMLPERFSIAYFCKADRVASVGPLSQFVPKDGKTTYEDITAIEYHQQRLLSAY
jgi:isopenicillin N synthase-like dioxygenase